MKSADLKLYAVSRCGAPIGELLESCRGGSTFLQLREKDLPRSEFIAKAAALREKTPVPFVINDDVETARASHADGVHVGQDDATVAEALAMLGDDAIVGVSCVTLEQAIKAEADGADYIGVGAMFPTGTKLDATAVTFDTLRAMTSSISIPAVAIGGISLGNVERLAGCGLAGCAVVSALFGSGDVAARTAKFAEANDRMLSVAPENREGLLVDMDGIVLDSLDLWDYCDRTFLERHGMLNAESLDALHHSGTIASAAGYVRSRGLDIDDKSFHDEIISLMEEGYRLRVNAIPGAAARLAELRERGVRMCLFTSSPERLAKPALRRLGLEDFFDAALYEADKNRRPDYYRAMELLGTGLRNTELVDDEDRVTDMAVSIGIAARKTL